MAERTLEPVRRLCGTLRVPGDKSISHRGLLFAAIAEGDSRLEGIAPGEDVRTTRKLLETLGVEVRDEALGTVVVRGRGWNGLDRDPDATPVDLDCGNSGTTTRLVLGLLAGRRGRFRLTGDASLGRRPMGRVTRPLGRLGATIEGGETLPLTVVGSRLSAIERLEPEVASAQVKSAIMLAALQAEGVTVLVEPAATRDHTERMLRAMGAPVEDLPEGAGWRVAGGAAPLSPVDMRIPGDPSSCAYAVALACVLAGSEVHVQDVSLNATRLGFYRLLRRMGGDVHCEEVSQSPVGRQPEPIGRLVARTSALRGIVLDRADVTHAIDEIPLVGVLGAVAAGETVVRGAEELRRKESDRIATTVELLRAFGAKAEELDDGFRVRGGRSLRGASVDSRGDHRIAMCAAVLAALSSGPSRLSGAEWVGISYPGFFDDLGRLIAPAS